MKERPILFSSQMVRALLAGTKTQTRRPMSLQPSEDTTVHVERFNQTVIDRHGDEQPGPEVFGAWWHDGESGLRCPYGQPGDRLWVRETWVDLHGTGIEATTGSVARCAYRADTPPGSYGDEKRKEYFLKWTPAIHMFRWASRITLEVTAVRVERLQDISEADARAEGLVPHRKGGWHVEQPPAGIEGTNHFGFKTARDAYRVLWEQINGADSWAANPFVWAISFRRIEIQSA